jgi:acyl-CoA-binding protein
VRRDEDALLPEDLMDLNSRFEAATAAVQGLTPDPGNEAKLKLYGLYKQATQGDADGNRPGFTNLVGRAKYDAWAAVAGTSPSDAKAAYVALVDELTRDSW